MLLSGCGSFWEDQGTASRLSAEARRASALAAQRDAEAAIIDAEARGAMAESQADALRQSVGAVVDLADDGEYIALFAGVMLAVLAFTGFVIWATHRRPVVASHYEPLPQSRQIATIKDDRDRIMFEIEQQPHETTAQFQVRLYLLAAQAAQREEALLLEAPKR
jgi:hypothetical protein